MLRYTPDENGNMVQNDEGEYIHASDLTALKVGLKKYKEHEDYMRALMPSAVNRDFMNTLFNIMNDIEKSLD